MLKCSTYASFLDFTYLKNSDLQYLGSSFKLGGKKVKAKNLTKYSKRVTALKKLHSLRQRKTSEPTFQTASILSKFSVLEGGPFSPLYQSRSCSVAQLFPLRTESPHPAHYWTITCLLFQLLLVRQAVNQRSPKPPRFRLDSRGRRAWVWGLGTERSPWLVGGGWPTIPRAGEGLGEGGKGEGGRQGGVPDEKT